MKKSEVKSKVLVLTLVVGRSEIKNVEMKKKRKVGFYGGGEF